MVKNTNNSSNLYQWPLMTYRIYVVADTEEEAKEKVIKHVKKMIGSKKMQNWFIEQINSVEPFLAENDVFLGSF
jgi:hypothetical protein